MMKCLHNPPIVIIRDITSRGRCHNGHGGKIFPGVASPAGGRENCPFHDFFFFFFRNIWRRRIFPI